MPRNRNFGSTSKEPPLEKLDTTLEIVAPGMTLGDLKERAAATPGTHSDAPVLLVNRFLTLDASGRITYDGLLALIKTHGVRHPRVRKVLYFVWVWRDERIRSFILDRIAGPGGRWRTEELLEVGNADFFEQYFARSTAVKTRSNVTRFLIDSGIFDPAAQTVNFSLDDGWLSDAMAIVAADEEPGIGAWMLRDPIGFLFERNWNGLIDLGNGEHPANQPGELATFERLDDTAIPPEPVHGAGRPWLPRDIGPLQASGSTPARDLVSLERASKAHQQLERIAATAIRDQGLVPLFTPSIDMYFEREDSAVVMEMKSCHAGNIHHQIRKGISQLLEYRYVSRNLFPPSTPLALILEAAPGGGRRWLIDYMISLGIFPAWKDPAEDLLVSTVPVPKELVGIVRQIDA